MQKTWLIFGAAAICACAAPAFARVSVGFGFYEPLAGPYYPYAYPPPYAYSPYPPAYQPYYEPPPAGPVAGDYCREYNGTAIIDGRRQHTYGTACRGADGQWHVVN